MIPRDFAQLCKSEKESLLTAYFNSDSETNVSSLIREMALSPSQIALMRKVADGILTDAMYGLLLGLDGAAAIGNEQQPYQLRDEAGNLLTGGELEVAAWEAFHA